MAVTVKYESDDGDLNASTKKQEDNFDRLRAAERRARTEANELNRLVKTGARDAATATDRWRKQVDLLKIGLLEGKINQSEFNDGIARAKQEFRDATIGANNLTKSVGLSVASFAGFATVAGVVSGVKTVLSDVRQEAEAAGQAAVTSLSRIGQLQQISDSPAELRRNLELRNRLFETGAFPSQAEASDAAFVLQSTGRDAEPFIALAKNAVVAADGLEPLIAAVATTGKNFTKIGSDAEVLSKGFAAAAKSPGNIQQILQAGAGVATGAASRGISGEAALAAVSTLSELLKSVPDATTRLTSLFATAERLSVRADTLPGLLQALDKAILDSGKEAITVLGSKEANQAFAILKENQDKFNGILDQIESAVDRDVLGQKLSLRGVDPSLDAGIALRTAQAVNEIAKEQIATVEQLRDAIGLQAETVRIALGEGAFSRGIARLERGAFRAIGGDGVTRLELAGLVTRANLQENELARQQVDILRSLIEQLERFNEQEAARRNQRISLPQAAGAN